MIVDTLGNGILNTTSLCVQTHDTPGDNPVISKTFACSHEHPKPDTVSEGISVRIQPPVYCTQSSQVYRPMSLKSIEHGLTGKVS